MLMLNIGYETTLTSEAVDVMSRVGLREARLVAVPIDGSDTRLPTPTALSRGDDGVAHTPICQPPWTAVVESVAPGCVQLSRGGQLCPMSQTVGLGLREGQVLVGGAMEHLALTEGDKHHI